MSWKRPVPKLGCRAIGSNSRRKHIPVIGSNFIKLVILSVWLHLSFIIHDSSWLRGRRIAVLKISTSMTM
jgi:hypothetical protein